MGGPTTTNRASGEYEARFLAAFAPDPEWPGRWEHRDKIRAAAALRLPTGGERYDGPEWDRYMATSTSAFRLRDEWVKRWSWAIPSVRALEAIAAVGPIVEIGAGTGYWTSLLRERGADVQAFELNPIYGNHYRHRRAYAAMARGDHWRALRMYPERTPMLCWAPYAEPMAAEVIRATRAERIVWVGELHGCNGDDTAMSLLGHDGYADPDDDDYVTPPAALFTLEREVEIPQWPGMHDAVGIYKRVRPPLYPWV